MQYEFESKLAMIRAVQYALNSNSDIISSYPKLVETINTLNEYIVKIPGNKKIDSQSIVEKIEKQNPEEQFSKLVMQVVNRLNSFASMVENIELMTETISLKNELPKLHSYELLEKGRKIYHQLIENFLSLEHFGIQDSTLKEYEINMRNFDIFLNKQDDRLLAKDFTIENFSIDEIVNFIEGTIDEQIKLLRIRYPKFYTEYQKSRILNENSNQTSNGDLSYKFFY